jgi:hypothetical protein
MKVTVSEGERKLPLELSISAPLPSTPLLRKTQSANDGNMRIAGENFGEYVREVFS